MFLTWYIFLAGMPHAFGYNLCKGFVVMDDVVSRRLTLKKGKNVIRGAVINGPGMSDFCVRFLDENGQPVKNLSISVQ